MIAPRTKQMDWVVFAGWTILIIVGQWLLPHDSIRLQWLAALWMWGGIWLVRRSSCLPFLLMTLPAFMCEIHRPWAWAQVLLAWGFLLRILIESRPGKREWLLMAAMGAVLVFFSWPLDYAARFEELAAYSKSELLHQWIQPQAVWAIFPFRQTVDRLLIAWLCMLLIRRKDYFSTPRLAGAFIFAAVMAILANYAAVFVPWYEPHSFLGTTNYGIYKDRLFHGAGYNQYYISFVVAPGLPWILMPFRMRRLSWTIGLVGLLIPLIFARQFALYLAMMAMVGVALIELVPVLANRERREKWKHHLRLGRRARMMVILTLLCSLGFSFTWAARMGALDKDSPLRRQMLYPLKYLRADYFQQQRAERRIAKRKSAVSSNPKREQLKRITKKPAKKVSVSRQLQSMDMARMNMWRLALRHSLKHHLWRGAGAGTWAPFHRAAPRSRRIYFAHAHNCYVDLVFEYGVLPMMFVFAFAFMSFVKIGRQKRRMKRVWIYYLTALAVLALGQHLLYAFTTMCAIIPAVVLLCKAWTNSSGNEGSRNARV